MKYLIIFLLFCASGCSKNNLPARDFHEEIIIRMNQNDAGDLELLCKTQTVFNCSNFTIVHSLEKRKDHFSIHFSDINRPPICLTALGPASAILNLGQLKEGVYEMDIKNGTHSNLFTLTVSKEKYSVADHGSPVNITFEESELIR